MNRRIAAFVVLALVLAVVFVFLGFWQLDRLGQRRARNTVLAARLAAPVLPFEQLRDTLSFRRATMAGTPDYANEIVFTGRSRQASPGVYLVTPFRRANNDTAVLVNRGWVYAPDAATVDVTRWREQRDVYSGYVLALPVSSASAKRPVGGRRVRALTRDVRALFPYPIDVRYVVAQDSGAGNAPARLASPVLDDGPHLSYAIQWFSFAAIAIVGAGAVVVRSREASSRSVQSKRHA